MSALAFQLSFDLAPTWDRLRLAASAAAEALGFTPVAWRLEQRQALEDKNHSGAAFEATYVRPGGTLREEVRSSVGNPRDGYGYDVSWRVELTRPDGRAAVLSLSDGSWEPRPKEVELRLRGIEPAELDAIRAALREVFGCPPPSGDGAPEPGEEAELPPDPDRSDRPHTAAANVRAAREVDRARARRWLAAALELGPPEHGLHAWRELLALDAELSGPSPERLRRRLSETPFDLEAWEEALASGDPALVALARPTLTLLRPFDPDALEVPADAPLGGWRRLEDGVGPRNSGWLPRLANDLLRELCPVVPIGSDAFVDAVYEGRRTASSSVLAHWSGQALSGPLQLRVIRTAKVFPPSWVELELLERLRAQPERQAIRCWHWGPEPEDCLHLREDAQRAGERLLHLGVLVGVTGSEAWRERVERALHVATPFRWVETDPAQPFPETEERPFAGLAAEGSRREAAAALLQEVGAATPAVLEALERCACAEPRRCEHTRLLRQVERAQRDGIDYSDPVAGYRVRAREHALRSAMAVLTQAPGHPRGDHEAHAARRVWAQAQACRDSLSGASLE